MKEILDRCCGIDVHKKTFTACLLLGKNKNLKKEIKTYSTRYKRFCKMVKR